MERRLHHVRTLHGLHAVSSESYSVCVGGGELVSRTRCVGGGGVSESYSSWAGPSPVMCGASAASCSNSTRATRCFK